MLHLKSNLKDINIKHDGFGVNIIFEFFAAEYLTCHCCILIKTQE